MSIRLVATTHPQFNTEELAFQLAEALHGEINCQRDADAFANQMVVENRKIAEIEFLIRQVEAFHKNPPEHISRMEPLASYDISSLQTQAEEAKSLRGEWADKKSMSLVLAYKYKEDQARLQKELSDRNKKSK